MNVGGVERSLLGLLSTLPLDQYEVHLGLVHKVGGLLDRVPTNVQVHEIHIYHQYWQLINEPPLWGIKKMAKVGHLWEGLVHLLLYAHFKLTDTRWLFYRYLLRHEPMLPGEYDVAVAFAGPSQMIDYYVCEKVDAKEKWGWIHFDVSKFGIDRGMTARLYKNYQHIYIVSEAAKKIFDGMFPQFRDKTEVRYNVVAKEQILQMADEGNSFTDGFEGIRILTVGRISNEKGQRLAIKALSLLRAKGHNVRWYFVGEGKDLEYCKRLVTELNVSDDAVFLGLQTNPYGYMRDCDIYVQPSRHEGYCITLAEALCFDHPIVATDFTGAQEQLKDRMDSIITSYFVEDLADGVEKVLNRIA